MTSSSLCALTLWSPQVPVNTTRNEILALIGISSKVLNDRDEPITILMERLNGVTTQAFIEFVTPKDAEKAMIKIHQTRNPKLGGLPVYCKLSDEETLMTALFPSARGVSWKDGKPTLNPKSRAFNGIISVEEMEILAKHADGLGVSTFSSASVQHALIDTSPSLAT